MKPRSPLASDEKKDQGRGAAADAGANRLAGGLAAVCADPAVGRSAGLGRRRRHGAGRRAPAARAAWTAPAPGDAGRCRCWRSSPPSAFARNWVIFLRAIPACSSSSCWSGIKFLEARTTRDGTLLICLALFLAITQFFYTQSILAAFVALPALFALGGTLAALQARSSPRGHWWRQLALPGRLMLQGIPLAILLFVLFPRLAGPLWGSPADAGARTGSVRSHGARCDQPAVAFRCGGVPGRLRWPAARRTRPLLARARVRPLQRPRVERLVPVAGWPLRAARRHPRSSTR